VGCGVWGVGDREFLIFNFAFSPPPVTPVTPTIPTFRR
jgi:hypothetical protein